MNMIVSRRGLSRGCGIGPPTLGCGSAALWVTHFLALLFRWRSWRELDTICPIRQHMNEVPLLRGPAICGTGKPICLARVFGLAFASLALPLALAQTPTVTPDHTTYYPAEPITIAFANGPGNPLDWIGIYPEGIEPGAQPSTAWFYVGGAQTAGLGLTDGSVKFAGGINSPGDWAV